MTLCERHSKTNGLIAPTPFFWSALSKSGGRFCARNALKFLNLEHVHGSGVL